MRLDKRGTEKYLSVYWFAILFIVAGAVVYMAILFYGEPYDVREVEANIMINKIADCVSSGGRFKTNIFEDGMLKLTEDNFLLMCNLNFNVEDYKGWDDDQYYVRVAVSYFVESEGKVVGSPVDFNWEEDILKIIKPLERSFYVLDESDNQYTVIIKSAVRKSEKNER